MSRSPTVARRALIVASCTLVLLSSCTSGKESADSAAASRSASRSAVALKGAPGSIPGLPGRLTQPLERYSADEFHAFVSTLTFGGGVDKPRKCKQDPSCVGGKQQTAARVDAVEGQDSLSALDLPVDGVVAVKVHNTGKFDEERYGLRPGAYDYYVVVLPGTGGGATWVMQELSTGPGARQMRQVGSGVFKPCNHAGGKPKPYRAHFSSCDDALKLGASSWKLGLVSSAVELDPPVWMTCSQGCCVVE